MGQNFSGSREQNYDNGDVYKGEFLDGKRHGRGIYMTKMGVRYEGEWADDQRCGQGTITFVSKDGKDPDADIGWAGTYQGQWNKDVKHGKGTFTYSNGDKYVGDWFEGKKQGKGVYVFAATGDRYEGEFLNNMFHGSGRYVYSNGDVFLGKWNEDEMHGTGTLTMPNGNTLMEEYEHGEKMRSVPTAWAEEAPVPKTVSVEKSGVEKDYARSKSNEASNLDNSHADTDHNSTNLPKIESEATTKDLESEVGSDLDGSNKDLPKEDPMDDVSEAKNVADIDSSDKVEHQPEAKANIPQSDLASVASTGSKAPSTINKSQGKSRKKNNAAGSKSKSSSSESTMKEVSLDDE